MRKLVFAINVSVDGYADHAVASADDELHDFFSDRLDETGVQLFGRVTYEMMASYWPHVPGDPDASRSDRAFAEKFDAVPKVVFSSTLERAEWAGTTLVKGDAVQYVAELKKASGKALSVGGIALAGALLKAGLVDEYWLVVHPVLAGKGRRLFETPAAGRKLALLETKRFASGAVALRYGTGDRLEETSR